MSAFQRYLFRNVLRTLVAIVSGLALIALLTTGLNQIEDLVVENRQSMLVFLWVTVLATPQIISLLTPIALFIATAGALNVVHRENEVVVAQASGMSNWQIASPVMRLAALAAILHLGLNLWVQPAASRELRQTVTQASTDLAASLVREGMFMQHGDGLTTFARQVTGTEMHDLLISDARNPDEIVTYIAKTAFLAQMEGSPVLMLRDGQRQSLSDNGSLELVTFVQSPLDLAPFMRDRKAVVLEESDRFLPELFFPDMNNYYDYANVNMLAAEGHARISAPLLNFAMAMLAIYAVLGGDFSRRGYAKRIALASAAAVMLRLLAFGAVAAGRDEPALNIVQYALPIFVIAAISFFYFLKPGKRRRHRRRGRDLRPSGPQPQAA